MTRPPFSYRIRVGHVSANPVALHLEADERERAALAEIWGVSAVHAFSAELDVARWKRDGVRMSGVVRASIEQPCVVTLEPVLQELEEPVRAILAPEGSKLARVDAEPAGEVIVDAEGPDPPETFSGDTIDAGVLAAEFAAMAIDHYPRKPGVGFADHVESGEDDDHPSPFAALKGWTGKTH